MSFLFKLGFNLKILILICCLDTICLNVILPSDLNTVDPLKKHPNHINEGKIFFFNSERAIVTTHSPDGHNVNTTAFNSHVNTGSHSSDQNGDASAGHAGSNEHHVAPPSYQLHPNTYHFKPEFFNLFSKQTAINQIMVGFTYPIDTHYDRYIFQIRYHGFDSYMTNKLKLNRTEPNFLLLNKFLDAQYVICVTLFSSSGLPEYKPISSSDMCIDVTIGESHTPGGHHSSTGYLTPLLVVVAVVLLLIIAIGDAIMHPKSKKHKSHELKPKIIECRSEMNLSKLNSHEEFNHQYSNKAFLNEMNSTIPQIKKQNIEIRYEDKNLTSSQTLRHVLDDKPWISNQQQRSNLT